jgi:hypothetical protein
MPLTRDWIGGLVLGADGLFWGVVVIVFVALTKGGARQKGIVHSQDGGVCWLAHRVHDQVGR